MKAFYYNLHLEIFQVQIDAKIFYFQYTVTQFDYLI